MKLRRLENAHVAFWIVKDYSWCTTTRWLGLAMVLPTLGLAIHLAYSTRDSTEDFAHNIATCFWIAANIVWMIGEFYFDDRTRRIAHLFFLAGIAVLAAHYYPHARKALRLGP